MRLLESYPAKELKVKPLEFWIRYRHPELDIDNFRKPAREDVAGHVRRGAFDLVQMKHFYQNNVRAPTIQFTDGGDRMDQDQVADFGPLPRTDIDLDTDPSVSGEYGSMSRNAVHHHYHAALVRQYWLFSAVRF